jgi:hypothetical protein
MSRAPDLLDRAISRISDFKQANASLLALLKQFDGVPLRAGSFSLVNGVLAATCLGINLPCRGKIVTRDCQPEAFEYLFVHQQEESWHLVVAIYLLLDGSLRIGSPFGSEIVRTNNTHLANRLLDAIAIELLKSKAFTQSAAG